MIGQRADMIRYFRFRLDLTRLLMVFLFTAFAGSAHAAPKAKLWERWTGHDAASKAVIDHAPWDRFLKSYLVVGQDGVNRVTYKQVAKPHKRALDAYVDRLAATPISKYNRGEQLAYWINLYNALTVRVILKHYPVESILKIGISPGWFSVEPWGKKLIRVEGQEVSLDDIEHRILRPIWRDPRIHYAVNCASIGCPNLRATAYTGATADGALTAAAKEYINHPRAVTLRKDGAYVSSIYKWFRDDFGGDDAGVLAHMRKYAAPPLAKKLSGKSIAGHVYDWSLNEPKGSS